MKHPLSRELMRESQMHEQAAFAVPTPRTPNLTQQNENMGSENADARDRAREVYWNFDWHAPPEVQLNQPGSSLTGRSIREELAEETLRPFVEGEPIGAYKQRKPFRPYTLSNWPELERKAMLELRAKNDAALTSLEESL